MASLDGHNSHKYTEQNREEAQFDKHKRVWELWKKETEEPTIKEIIESMRNQEKNAPVESQKNNGFDSRLLQNNTEISYAKDMNTTARNKTDFAQHNLLSQSVLGPLHKTFFDLKSPQNRPSKNNFDSSERKINKNKSIKAKNINDLKLGKHKFLTLKDN